MTDSPALHALASEFSAELLDRSVLRLHQQRQRATTTASDDLVTTSSPMPEPYTSLQPTSSSVVGDSPSLHALAGDFAAELLDRAVSRTAAQRGRRASQPSPTPAPYLTLKTAQQIKAAEDEAARRIAQEKLSEEQLLRWKQLASAVTTEVFRRAAIAVRAERAASVVQQSSRGWIASDHVARLLGRRTLISCLVQAACRARQSDVVVKWAAMWNNVRQRARLIQRAGRVHLGGRKAVAQLVVNARVINTHVRYCLSASLQFSMAVARQERALLLMKQSWLARQAVEAVKSKQLARWTGCATLLQASARSLIKQYCVCRSSVYYFASGGDLVGTRRMLRQLLTLRPLPTTTGREKSIVAARHLNSMTLETHAEEADKQYRLTHHSLSQAAAMKAETSPLVTRGPKVDFQQSSRYDRVSFAQRKLEEIIGKRRPNPQRRFDKQRPESHDGPRSRSPSSPVHGGGRSTSPPRKQEDPPVATTTMTAASPPAPRATSSALDRTPSPHRRSTSPGSASRSTRKSISGLYALPQVSAHITAATVNAKSRDCHFALAALREVQQLLRDDIAPPPTTTTLRAASSSSALPQALHHGRPRSRGGATKNVPWAGRVEKSPQSLHAATADPRGAPPVDNNAASAPSARNRSTFLTPGQLLERTRQAASTVEHRSPVKWR